MKALNLLLLIVIAVVLTSCSAFQSNLDTAVQNQTVPYVDNLVPDPNAESVLEGEFLKSKVPWDKESLQKIIASRNAIKAMGQYLEDRVNFDSSLPYYTYKSSFEYFQNQYNILQNELDKRIAIEGALSAQGQVIYYYVRRDVNNRLKAQQVRLVSAEKAITDKASTDNIEELKDIYATIKPLLEMVL